MLNRTTRVGTLLLWLVFAVASPLVLFTVANIWREHEAGLKSEQTQLSDISLAAAEHADLRLQNLRSSLVTLADSGILRYSDPQGNEPETTRDISTVAERIGVPLMLTDWDGEEISRSSSGIPPVPAMAAVVRRAVSTQAPLLSDLLPADPRQGRVVTLVVPGHRADGSTFAIAAILNKDWLATLAQPRPDPQGLAVAILDRQGNVVAGLIRQGGSIPPTAPQALRVAVGSRTSGVIRTVSVVGHVPLIAAFTRGASGFTAVASLPARQFGAERHVELLETLAVAAAMLAMGLIVGSRISRRLVAALRAMGRADGSAAPHSGLREVDDLAQRLHEIALQRDATETSLRQSETRLRDLVATLDLAAIMTRDMDGTIVFWSQGCVRMYGWLPEEAVGQSYYTLLRAQFPRSLAEIEQSLYATGTWTGDLVHRRRDGARIVAASRNVLVRGRGGAPDRITEALVDVTALREAEDTLRAINQNLEQRVQAEIAAREAAQERAVQADRIRALGQLAGGIAHDFNNILQAIAGSAALIARHPEDADMVARFNAIISDAATRGASITRRVLLLARRGDLRAEPLDVATLLADVREVFVHTLGAGIDIELDIAPDLPMLMADKAQLETALVNLATNARDAMPDGGTLRITAAADSKDGDAGPRPAELPPGQYVRLSVSDNGVGMDPALLARVGEPFFTTKSVGKGTGLGLSMVKGFAEQSRGAFAIESWPGQGTKVTIWLPSDPDWRMPARRTPTLASDTPSILLVDDDELVRDTVAEQLEDLGHEVLSAACGTDALAILRARESIDLMITDLSMPGMSGVALINEAREVRPRLPAILLTGYANEAAAMAQGTEPQPPFTLIRKPASTEVLKARIGELLGMHADA